MQKSLLAASVAGLLALTAVGPARAATVSVQATKTSGLDAGGWTGNAPLTWTDFTFSLGDSGMLVVVIAGEGGASATDFNVSWNSVALTRGAAAVGNSAYAFVYYLASPAVGSGTLSVTLNNNIVRYGATALYATGVLFLESFAVNTAADVTTLSAGPTSPVSAGALVVSAAGQINGNTGYTTDSGIPGAHTRLLNIVGSNGSSAGADYFIASGGSELTATWTLNAGTGAGGMSAAIASFKPAGPAEIRTFDFGAYGAAAISGRNISLTVPFGTALATLAPTFTLSSGTCIPATGVAPNFALNNPATYTVTDGVVTNLYAVTITVAAKSTACDLLSFGPGAVITGTAIDWLVPFGTEVASLTPTLTISPLATVAPTNGATVNFTAPVKYTVTAQDGTTTKDYTVTVVMSPLTVTNTYNLGAQGSGTTLLPGTNGLLPWITMGTWPPGTLLRSASVNVRLDAADIDSWASDINVYVDPLPAEPGTAATLQVGGYGKIGTVENWVRWGVGDNGPGTTVTARKIAPDDFPDWIDLNTAQLSVGNDYGRATWSGTITVTYEPPPATLATFGIPGYPAVIDHAAKTIAWTVPYGTVLTALAPTFTLTSGTGVPGTGVAPNFALNNPATYTVGDRIGGITNVYTVAVTVAPVSTACDLLSFGPGAAIAGTDVAWLVPFGTDVSSLTPTLTISPLATVSPTNGATVNFTAPVKYTVTAQDGTTLKEYTVTVTINVPILVGASGSGASAFDTLPPAGKWASLRIPGGGGTATSPTTMDALVNTLKANSISNTLATVTADQTSGSAAAGGAWNSTDLRLTSRATSTAGAGIMATLRNTSGAAINELDLGFTLFGSAAAGEDSGLAGYALYYSLTGMTESWRRIGVYGTPGPVTITNIPLSGVWADGGTMYVLWVDDNGNPGGDGWYGFDNVTFAKSTPAADILTFNFGVYGPAIISGTDITVNVPYWVDAKTLAPTYTTTYGATCAKASGSSQNFTSPVHYLVTSLAPVITKDYAVTVNLVAPSGKTFVNLDTTAREGLEGPAGGLGKTWNQVVVAASMSISGGLATSALLDSDGLPSDLGFTLQSSQLALFEWGTPALKLLTAGAFSWNWDAPATFIISGLKPDRKYDLYLASFHPNEGGSSSVFSTTNTTTTVSPQIANSGGPNGNNLTWEQGVNYVRFDNVEPDAAKNITVTMVGDGGSSTIRAYLSGFQLVEAPATIPTPVIKDFTGSSAGPFTLLGATDIAGKVVTVMTTSLSPPVVWTPVQTNAVPGGAFSLAIPRGTGPAAFYKVMGQ